MKKSIAFLILTTSIICHAATSENNPRNILVTAIARSDFGTTLKALEQITDMTDQEQYQYMQMADQIIIANTMWLATHSTHPEIGKDLFKGIGYLLGTLASAAISVGGVAVITDVIDQNSINNPPLFIVALASLGLTGFLGYKTIRKFIDAWQNPSIRLENALRIKDALFHCANSVPALQMNLQGGYSTAIGVSGYSDIDSEALTLKDLSTDNHIMPDAAVGSARLSYHREGCDAHLCNCTSGLHCEHCNCSNAQIELYNLNSPVIRYSDGSFSNTCITPCCCPSETNFSCRCTDHTCVKYSSEQA